VPGVVAFGSAALGARVSRSAVFGVAFPDGLCFALIFIVVNGWW
jgi:hypothetical protein